MGFQEITRDQMSSFLLVTQQWNDAGGLHCDCIHTLSDVALFDITIPTKLLNSFPGKRRSVELLTKTKKRDAGRGIPIVSYAQTSTSMCKCQWHGGIDSN